MGITAPPAACINLRAASACTRRAGHAPPCAWCMRYVPLRSAPRPMPTLVLVPSPAGSYSMHAMLSHPILRAGPRALGKEKKKGANFGEKTIVPGPWSRSLRPALRRLCLARSVIRREKKEENQGRKTEARAAHAGRKKEIGRDNDSPGSDEVLGAGPCLAPRNEDRLEIGRLGRRGCMPAAAAAG